MAQKFNSKNDYIVGLEKIIGAFENYYNADLPGHLKFGESGSVYNEGTRQAEGFLRTLWGLGPLFTSKRDEKLVSFVKEGIVAGTNPEHPSYWGEPSDYDQLIVEMAALATTLLLTKEWLWEGLTEKEKDNLYQWLNTVNHRVFSQNNWLFFRVLVNVWFKKSGQLWDKKMVEEDLEKIESFYIGNGWYYDGRPSQTDYYISFAIHYYSLIYCKFMADDDPERVLVFKNRAIEFAQTFKTWFDDRGEAIPFGRSLTYRFAQSAFWSALVFADVEALPWGEIKWLVGKNMERWFEHRIFSRQGRLTIGYHYENLVMAEGYNAPGSPYWALKTFLLLASPENHPIWSTEMIEPIYDRDRTLIKEANMLMVRGKNHLQMFPAGRMESYQAHSDAKYAKLVYSTVFGFSVSKSERLYTQGGFDNVLAVSEDDSFYRTPFKVTESFVSENEAVTVWHPYRDVTVKSRVYPLDSSWHIRIHEIDSGRELIVRDGGFSIPFDRYQEFIQTPSEVSYKSDVGVSSIFPIHGYDKCELTIVEPNTNLYFELSAHPSAKANLQVGKHYLISLVGGEPKIHSKYENNLSRPQVVMVEGGINIIFDEKSKFIKL